MRVTECCRLMLQWTNGHGFVTIQQAATWMQVGFEPARHRLGLLVKAEGLHRLPGAEPAHAVIGNIFREGLLRFVE